MNTIYVLTTIGALASVASRTKTEGKYRLNLRTDDDYAVHCTEGPIKTLNVLTFGGTFGNGAPPLIALDGVPDVPEEGADPAEFFTLLYSVPRAGGTSERASVYRRFIDAEDAEIGDTPEVRFDKWSAIKRFRVADDRAKSAHAVSLRSVRNTIRAVLAAPDETQRENLATMLGLNVDNVHDAIANELGGESLALLVDANASAAKFKAWIRAEADVATDDDVPPFLVTPIVEALESYNERFDAAE